MYNLPQAFCAGLLGEGMRLELAFSHACTDVATLHLAEE